MSQQPQLINPIKSPIKSQLKHLPLPITVGTVGLVMGFLSNQPTTPAQSITAANDGTGTLVEQNGTAFTIEQGSLSDDQQNLFHSFETFSIEPGQSANFIASPTVQNILSRVNGGMPSVLEGLLQVSGSGQPNLYLMNPAGVLFGANAQVNLPGKLTVTTADGIGFAQEWFSTFSDNNYNNLIGAPSGEFAFLNPEGSHIVNSANLTVPAGNAIALLGGSVINTGILNAPGGSITIAAIPNNKQNGESGDNIVRISQENSLLSLELTATPEQSPIPNLNSFSLNSFGALITPLDLPTLLTSSAQQHATGLTVNADGTVSLTGTDSLLPIADNVAIASGTITTTSDLTQGGQIAILGDHISLLNAQLSASGSSGGGNIRIGGDYQGRGPLPTAHHTFIDNQTTLTANATQSGNGGRVIIWSDDTTAYLGHTSVNGGPTAGNGGFVEVSGKINLGFHGSVDAAAPQGTAGSLLLDPEVIEIQPGGQSPQDGQLTDGQISLTDNDPGLFYVISEAALENLSGGIDLVLEASDRITLRNLSDNRLDLAPGTGNILFKVTGNANDDGIIETIDPNDTIFTNGRSITITAPELDLGNIVTATEQSARSGDITLTSSNNDITVGDLATLNPEISGNIFITSDADISIDGNIQTGAPSMSINGGNVSISAIEDVTTQLIQTDADGTIGTLSITSQIGDIETGELLVGPPANITLTANNGDIIIDGELISTNTPGNDPDPGNNPPNGPGSNFEDNFFFPPDSYFEDYDFEDNGFEEQDFEFLDDRGELLEDGEFGDSEFGNNGGLLALDSEFDIESDSEGPEFRDEEFESRGFRDEELEERGSRDEEFRDREDRPGRREFEQDDIERDELEQDDPDQTGPAEDTLEGSEDVYEAQTFEIDQTFADEVLINLENTNTQAYANYFQAELPTEDLSLNSVQTLLKDIEAQSGNRSAVIYINTSSSDTLTKSQAQKQTEEQTTEQTTHSPELVIVTAQGNPIRVTLPNLSAPQLFQTIEKFRADIISSARRGGDYYLPAAQQLYQWLIAPIEAELDNIDTLVFSMDEGLRTLPIAALHDGEQYLVEKYSLGMVPALSLIDPQYQPLGDAEVLAMGVSDFEQLSPLPAVPLEIELINDLWPGSTFLNEGFTRQTLIDQRQQSPYRLIHLATHAEFKSGTPDNSYIQLWDEQLKLSELHRLGWQYPAVDLLVLSACSTAVGSPEAEMGFAGLAVAAGVRSAMASLWSVSDVGTLALMSEFYEQLQAQPTKSEALRAAQLALLSGNIRTAEGQLLGNAARGGVTLPIQLGTLEETNFSHPYYWSGFTMIGSPW